MEKPEENDAGQWAWLIAAATQPVICLPRDRQGTITADRRAGVTAQGQDTTAGGAEGTPSNPEMGLFAVLPEAAMLGGKVGEAPVLGVAPSSERVGVSTGLTNSAVPESENTEPAPEVLSSEPEPQRAIPNDRIGQIRVVPSTRAEAAADNGNTEVAFAVLLRPSKDSQTQAAAESAPTTERAAARIAPEPEGPAAAAEPGAVIPTAIQREALPARQPGLLDAAKTGTGSYWMAEEKPAATSETTRIPVGVAASSLPQSRQFSSYFPPKTAVSQAPARPGSTASRAEPRSGMEDRSRGTAPAISTDYSEPQAGPSRTVAREHGPESGGSSRSTLRDAAEARHTTPSGHSEFAREVATELADLQGAASVRTEPRANAQPVEVEGASVREATVKALRSTILEQRTNPAATVREISFRVTDANRAQATVQLVEREGRIQVTVRTADTELAKELRLGLNDLLTSLEKTGIRGEAWKPVGAAVESSSMDFRRDERNQEGNRHQFPAPDTDDGQRGHGKQNPFKRMFDNEDLGSLTGEEWTVWT